MFAIAGGGLAAAKLLSEEYKVRTTVTIERFLMSQPPRYNLDRWDRQMMERDRRLTGSRRGQSDEPIAPSDFKVNSAYMV